MGKIVVAIDGPVGAGKSTVAREVARALGYLYIDTGAMYRAVAWAARQRSIPWEDEGAASSLAATLPIRLEATDAAPRVLVDGQDVTTAIRSPEMSTGASVVSTHPGVREALVRQQQQMGAVGGVVMEGRDIGTVVFPHAELKVFLDASVEERAHRRHAELQARSVDQSLDQVIAEVAARDERDRNRAVAPLQQAPDAVAVNTDGSTIPEVVARIVGLARERGA